ncbi:MAG: hypothetical protein GY805_38865 [Chloroflexi bacterium]|nr:hypothetical protein [Chloroflexota bacterium]
MIVPDFSNPQSLNRYSYVYNNPLKFTDPSGHFGKDVHYDLTYDMVYYAATYFANRYGLENVEQLATNLAKTVAGANQSVDDPGEHPEWLPTKLSSTPHWYNHNQATTWVQEAVDGIDAEMFGQSLHALQDYFSHFGQGFIAEIGDSGENLYALRLAWDDRQPFVTEEVWRERSREWGHGTNLSPKSWDDFDWNDPRCQEMVEENIYWIYQFLEVYFQENYGSLPPEYIGPWLLQLESGG